MMGAAMMEAAEGVAMMGAAAEAAFRCMVVWLACTLTVAEALLPVAPYAQRATPSSTWPSQHATRRTVLTSAGASTALLLLPQQSLAATASVALAAATTLAGKLEASAALAANARMPIGLAIRPTNGIETPDVHYPPWALGRWTATSTLRSVYAPAGEDLFAPGRNGTEALRLARVDTPLTYEVRWRRSGDGEGVVVDRGYNVASISRASLGSRCSPPPIALPL